MTGAAPHRLGALAGRQAHGWPLPQRLGLSRGSATIVAKALLKKALIEERLALGHDAIWREAEDGRPMTLVITKAGLAAAGMLPEIAGDRKQGSDGPTQRADDATVHDQTTAVSENRRRIPRAGTKLAQLVALLERKEGATVAEAAAALGWQAHIRSVVLAGSSAWSRGSTAIVRADRTTLACESGYGNWRPSADASAIAGCTFC
jgi:hypothetical protein